LVADTGVDATFDAKADAGRSADASGSADAVPIADAEIDASADAVPIADAEIDASADAADAGAVADVEIDATIDAETDAPVLADAEIDASVSVEAAADAEIEADTASDASVDAAPDATSQPLDACVPGMSRSTLENACTNAECSPFTGSVPFCDGGLCPLPSPDASTPSSDGGDASDAGSGSCTALGTDSNNVVFITGSTALASFIGEVSKVLATQSSNRVTVVYQQSGSCVGVRSVLDPTNNPLDESLGSSTYYDSSGNQQTCTFSAADGVSADIGASDVFYSTCYIGQAVTPMLPQSVAENLGPVQVMNFAVPQGSTQRSISLAAAYYVFGFGGAQYPIAPWTDPTQLQIRSAASGTQSMIGAAIGVPPDQWQGVGHATSSDVGAALVAAGQSSYQAVIDSALGILASDYLLQSSAQLRGLAVQDENTSCGYFPSTTATAHDAANVRDGHYPLWGPSHFYARVNSHRQTPLKSGVTQFINGLSGVTPLPGLDLVGEYAQKGLVPTCAMSVTRADDGNNYTPYTPAPTCNCYFDFIATGATTCRPCSTNADCQADSPNCNKWGPSPQQGYCDR
ncbi:MAG: hypothetical protein FWD17_11295, partial [Polyangiaceae bacterium]|nr:hypothetical protein [Polyangiaceae bacterium]